jgi:pimeloyl-ACP methyl ester carboxylesterase
MTLPKMAQPLVQKAKNSRTVLLEAGHNLMNEAPDGVLFAIKEFLQP